MCAKTNTHTHLYTHTHAHTRDNNVSNTVRNKVVQIGNMAVKDKREHASVQHHVYMCLAK